MRASVGELGSDNTDAFLHRSIFNVEKNAYIFGGVPYAGLGASNSITSSLTWSTTRSYNIGADLTMWNGLLGVEFDLFYKLTKDIQESRSGGFLLH
ncbi:TonB-dependent receptor [Bacteroides sp. BFG-606]|nr:TonB-dependent receptor [Bacteroides sp. BFG-606]